MKSGRRPNFPIAFKVMVAARACEPGVSVSRLAREHDLNTNLLFRWRRQYRSGELRTPATTEPMLLPISLAAESDSSLVELPNPATRFGNAPATRPTPSVIEVRIADAVVRVEGEVDVVRLRAVLSALRG
jgi:transposase